MNRTLALGIVGGALALALAGGTAAAAPTTSSRPTITAAQATPQPAAPSREGRLPARLQRQLVTGLVKTAADVTGLKPREVAVQLRNGKSLAQIAEAKGKTANDIIQAARIKLKERLDKAVAEGKITQERADTALTNFDQAAPQIVNRTDLLKQKS